VNPSWIDHVIQNFVYVENCSLAHLCYERCLIDLINGFANPDVGGQAFAIADPGPPPTYGDVYSTLTLLTDGETRFPRLSPTLMIFISHIIEWFYLSRILLERAPSPFSFFARLIPKVSGDIVNLQPSIFALVMPHLLFSCARAMLPPAKGGIGYAPRWTTLEGLCKLVIEHKAHVASGGVTEERQLNGGGGIGWGLVKAEKGVKTAGEGVGLLKKA